MRFLSVVFKLCNSLQLTRFQIKVGAKRFLVCDKKEDKQATIHNLRLTYHVFFYQDVYTIQYSFDSFIV